MCYPVSRNRGLTYGLPGGPSAQYTIVQDGDVINTRRDKKTLELKNGKPFECTITNATLLEEDFTFRVHHTDAPGAAIKLEVYGSCDISISGAFKISSPFNCFDVRACGHIQEAVLLGNLISRQVPDPKRYNEFSVGFKKKAINVIRTILSITFTFITVLTQLIRRNWNMKRKVFETAASGVSSLSFSRPGDPNSP